MNARLSILALALILSGCAMLTPSTQRSALLFNPVISANSLDVSVMSDGCTDAQSYYLKVSDTVIEVRHARNEQCSATGEMIRLSFDYPFQNRVYEFLNEVRYSNRVMTP